MSVKRAFTLFAAIAVMLVIAACGGNPTSSTEPPAPVSINTPATPTDAPEANVSQAQAAYTPVTVESCIAANGR